MFYFDKYGTPLQNPFSKDVPAGVTIKSVLDNYLVAMMVEKSGESRKTIAMVGSTVITQAIAFNFYFKSRCKGKLNVEIAMGTMSMMQVNETGICLQQGNEKNLKELN
jgi:hypothetical protein